MVEARGNIYYLSLFLKERRVPIEVARRETQARIEFLETFIPKIHGYFQKRGVNVLIDVIGSVAACAAIETSDIDLLIREDGTENLDRVRRTGLYVRAYDIRERELPYKVQLWFDHPYGSEAYRRLVEWEETQPLAHIVNSWRT